MPSYQTAVQNMFLIFSKLTNITKKAVANYVAAAKKAGSLVNSIHNITFRSLIFQLFDISLRNTFTMRQVVLIPTQLHSLKRCMILNLDSFDYLSIDNSFHSLAG